MQSIVSEKAQQQRCKTVGPIAPAFIQQKVGDRLRHIKPEASSPVTHSFQEGLLSYSSTTFLKLETRSMSDISPSGHHTKHTPNTQ